LTLRNTLARVFALFIALGYGIVTNMIERYASSIALLWFLSLIAFALSQACFYINQYKELTDSVRFFGFFPAIVIDLVFVWWISLGLRRTLSYLLHTN
jgi:hypothetical protein